MLELYYTPGSAPCRAVLLTAAALDIELDLKFMDLRATEQLKPEFVQLNPQHTVPVLIDNGFKLLESRTIARYLVNKYAPGYSLYPQDVQLRALVDQRLDFDAGTLTPRFADYFYPQLFAGAPARRSLLKKLQEALGFLDSFLEGHTYAAGSTLTLADFSLVATVSTIQAAGIDLKEYTRVLRWFNLVKSTAPSYEEANGSGVRYFGEFVSEALKIKSGL